MRRILAIIIAMCMLGMPLANAQPKNTIIVINHSKYISNIDYKVLYDYLDLIASYWSIYHGKYYIYLSDYLPDSISFPPGSLGGHIKGVKAYVNIKDIYYAHMDPYLIITHELAEMAVNPNLRHYDRNGNLLEICDGIYSYIYFYGNGPKRQVSLFRMPSDYAVKIA